MSDDLMQWLRLEVARRVRDTKVVIKGDTATIVTPKTDPMPEFGTTRRATHPFFAAQSKPRRT